MSHVKILSVKLQPPFVCACGRNFLHALTSNRSNLTLNPQKYAAVIRFFIGIATFRKIDNLHTLLSPLFFFPDNLWDVQVRRTVSYTANGRRGWFTCGPTGAWEILKTAIGIMRISPLATSSELTGINGWMMKLICTHSPIKWVSIYFATALRHYIKPCKLLQEGNQLLQLLV